MKLVGLLSYNGIVFNGSTQVTLTTESVRDEADRITAYVRHTITAKGVLYYPAGTDGTMTLCRSALEEVGRPLIFSQQGAGDFSVNTNGGRVWDVKNGPKPKVVAWAPIGSLLACEVLWTCEFCLPRSFSAFWTSPGDNPYLAFNYGISYSLDARGATTRTISGYLEIAQQWSGTYPTDMKTFRTADQYRSAIAPTIPEEFKRTQQEFKLSLDKSRLDFHIVDEEIPSDNAYPEGVANIDARHSVVWTRGKHGGGFLRNRLVCEIELAFNQPMVNAWAIFLVIANERKWKASSAGHYVLIDDLSAEEGIFNRRASFSMSWRCTYDAPSVIFKSFLTSTGLFQSLGCSPTWTKWASSMATTAETGGYQRLTSDATKDRIVGMSAGQDIPWGHTQSAIASKPELGSAYLVVQNETPAPEKSWVEFDHWVEIVRDTPAARHSIMQAAHAPESQQTQDPNALLYYPTTSGTADKMQTSGEPKYLAIVSGYARRAGHNIPRPSYPTIGDATATEMTARFAQKIAGKWLGVTIYMAAWQIVYALDKSPGTVNNLPNIAEGVQT